MQGKIMLMIAITLCVTVFAIAEAESGSKEVESMESVLRKLKEVSLSKQDVLKLAGKDGWKVYDGNPVIKTGKKGEWDAGALGSMSVIKVGDIFHMWYESWGVRSNAEWDAEEYNSLQIGHTVSLDGVHWAKDPASPAVPRGAKGEWDRTGTWDPFVIYEDGIFKMWYGGGGGDAPCDWAYAESKDGRKFKKKGKISELGGVEDCHVVHDKAEGKYHMYYWDRDHEPIALFRATSSDEMNFDFKNAEKIHIEGENYPAKYKFTHVFIEDGTWIMYYGNFERPYCPNSTVRFATSKDGVHWTARNRYLLEGHDAEVLKVDKNLYMMYYGPQNYFDAKDCDIRLAIYNGDLMALAKKK